MKMAYFLPFAISVAASGYFQWRWRNLNGLRELPLPDAMRVMDVLKKTEQSFEASADIQSDFFEELPTGKNHTIPLSKANATALGEACEHLVGITFIRAKNENPRWRFFPVFLKWTFIGTGALVFLWLMIRSAGGGKWAKFAYWGWQPLMVMSLVSWWYYRRLVKQTIHNLPQLLPEGIQVEAETILQYQSLKPLLAFFAPIRFTYHTVKTALIGP